MMPRAASGNWTGLVVKEGPRYCLCFDIGIGNWQLAIVMVMVDGAKHSVGGPLRCTLDSPQRGHHDRGLHCVSPVVAHHF